MVVEHGGDRHRERLPLVKSRQIVNINFLLFLKIVFMEKASHWLTATTLCAAWSGITFGSALSNGRCGSSSFSFASAFAFLLAASAAGHVVWHSDRPLRSDGAWWWVRACCVFGRWGPCSSSGHVWWSGWRMEWNASVAGWSRDMKNGDGQSVVV